MDSKFVIKLSAIYFVGIILNGLLSFITIPLIVNYYGAEEYGTFSLFQNTILITLTLGSGWLHQSVLRFNDYSFRFRFNIFQLNLLSAIPMSIICFGVLIMQGTSLILSLIGTITVFIGGILSLRGVFFQSNFQPKKSVFLDFIRIFSFTILAVFFYFSFSFIDKVSRLITSFFFSYIISFISLKDNVYFMKMSFKYFQRKFCKEYIILLINKNKKVMNYGLPLSLWLTFSGLLNFGDRFVIDYYLNQVDLGIYSAIYDIVYKVVSLIGMSILLIGMPIISLNFNNGNISVALNLIIKLLFLELIIFSIIGIIIFFYKTFFLVNILGLSDSTINLSLIFPILAGSFIWQFAMIIHKYLEFKNRTKLMTLFVLIVCVLNIFLNIMFIPKYGILFAAYATFISAVIYLFLISFFVFYNKKKEFSNSKILSNVRLWNS